MLNNLQVFLDWKPLLVFKQFYYNFSFIILVNHTKGQRVALTYRSANHARNPLPY